MSHRHLTEAEVLSNLPATILLDVARNESAPRTMRKAAVKLMLEKKFRQAQHPDLLAFRVELQKEQEAEQEVQALVESQIEAPIESVPVMRAGVTTANLQQDGPAIPPVE